MLHLCLTLFALTTVLPVNSIPPLASDAPNRQPTFAVSGRNVAVAFGSANTIWFTRSLDGGEHFPAPVKVAEVGALALGRHRGPRIAMFKDHVVLTAVTSDHTKTGPHAFGLPDKGELRAWRSSDGGKTWSDPVVVNDTSGAAQEGLQALTQLGPGTIAAVWLDGREKATALYGSYSRDGGASWSKNERLYASPSGTICQCCHPSMTVADSSKLQVMFRNVVNGARDLWTFGWQPGTQPEAPSKLGMGSWALNACPMDGGGIAVEDGRVYSAWRRDKQVYLAEPGRQETVLGSGKDVSMAVHGDEIAVTWTGENGAPMMFDSKTGQARQLHTAGGYSSIAATSEGFIAAWERDGAIQIKVLNASKGSNLSMDR